MGAVLKRMNDRGHFHAGHQGLGNPALPRQAARSAHFNRPLLHLSLLIRDVHQDPAVGVGPLEFLHSAFQCGLLFGVEHGKRMVRKSGDRVHGDRYPCEPKCFEFH